MLRLPASQTAERRRTRRKGRGDGGGWETRIEICALRPRGLAALCRRRGSGRPQPDRLERLQDRDCPTVRKGDRPGPGHRRRHQPQGRADADLLGQQRPAGQPAGRLRQRYGADSGAPGPGRPDAAVPAGSAGPDRRSGQARDPARGSRGRPAKLGFQDRRGQRRRTRPSRPRRRAASATCRSTSASTTSRSRTRS